MGGVLSHGEVRELQRERNEARRKRTGLSSDIRLGVDNLPFSALEKFRDAWAKAGAPAGRTGLGVW